MTLPLLKITSLAVIAVTVRVKRRVWSLVN